MDEGIDFIQLPEGWVWKQVQDVSAVVPITGRKLKQRHYTEEGKIPVVDQGQGLIGGFTDKDDLVVDVELPVVVFGDHTRAIKYVDFKFVAGADGIKVLKPFPEFHPKLFYHFLRSLRLPDKGYARHYKFLKKSYLPLPPVSQQQEIASILDAASKGIEKAKEELSHIPNLTRRLRMAILSKAVRGDLTRNDSFGESAEQFVARIKGKLDKRIEDECYDAPNDFTYYSLPKGWIWVQLGVLTNLTSGKAFKKSEYSRRGLRLFQIANVSFGETKWDSLQYLPEDYARIHSNLLLKEGDVLIALNRPLLGGQLKTAILGKSDVPSILYQRVGRFDLYEKSMGHFLFYFLQSSLFISQLREILRGIDQPFVTKGKLLNIFIPLAPEEHQRRIVDICESVLRYSKSIELMGANAKRQLEVLESSILRKAFLGQMSPKGGGAKVK